MATSGQALSLPIMFNGIGNRLVDLGLDSVVGVEQANFYYNIISFALVFCIAAYADFQSSAMFSVLATMMAAICAWFGWFTCSNALGPWGIVTMCGVLSVAMYMTEQNRMIYGAGTGGGDKVVGIVMFILLLQASVTMINGVNVFGTEIGATTDNSYCSATGGNYTNCQMDGALQLQGISTNTGTESITGTNNFNYLSSAVTIGWQMLGLIAQLLIGIAAFSVVLAGAFPTIINNPGGMAVIGVLQVGIWVIYAFAIFRYVWKTMPGDAKL
jgi:hypothetical protein